MSVTPERLAAFLAHVKAKRVEAGLPEHVEDEAVLRRIAAIVLTPDALAPDKPPPPVTSRRRKPEIARSSPADETKGRDGR